MSDRFEPFDIHTDRYVEIVTEYIRHTYGEPDGQWLATVEATRSTELKESSPKLLPGEDPDPFWSEEDRRKRLVPTWSYDDFKRAAHAPPAKPPPGYSKSKWAQKHSQPGVRKAGFEEAKKYLAWYGIERDGIVGVPPSSFSESKFSSWPYYGAAIALVVERARSVRMKCMSCKTELTAQTTKIFNTILVCSQCNELAEKAEREIAAHIERAKQLAANWLEQHVLQGGLLRGGTGYGPEEAGLPIRFPAPVQELRSEEGAEAPSVPLPDREPSAD